MLKCLWCFYDGVIVLEVKVFITVVFCNTSNNVGNSGL